MPAPRTALVALAGESVVGGWAGSDGVVQVRSAPVDGGTPVTLFAWRPPRGTDGGVVALDASSERVAFVVAARRSGTGGPVSLTAYGGPPQGPFAVLARYRRKDRWLPQDVRVSGGDVLLTEVTAGLDRVRFSVHSADGSVRSLRMPQVTGVAFAGDLVAYARPGRRIVERDWTTGAVRFQAKLDGDANGIDLTPDGAVLVDDESAAGAAVRVADPGAPQLRTVFADPSYATSHVVWAGTRIVAVNALRQLEVIDPAGGGAPRPIGHPSAFIGRDEPTPAGVDADDQRAVWSANGCIWSTGLDDPATLEVPPGPCPQAEVELVDDQPGRLGSDGRIAVHLRCVAGPPEGCNGTVTIRTPNRRRVIGTEPFALAPGQESVLRVLPAGRIRGLPLLRVRAVATDPAGRRSAAEIIQSVGA